MPAINRPAASSRQIAVVAGSRPIILAGDFLSSGRRSPGSSLWARREIKLTIGTGQRQGLVKTGAWRRSGERRPPPRRRRGPSGWPVFRSTRRGGTERSFKAGTNCLGGEGWHWRHRSGVAGRNIALQPQTTHSPCRGGRSALGQPSMRPSTGPSVILTAGTTARLPALMFLALRLLQARARIEEGRASGVF